MSAYTDNFDVLSYKILSGTLYFLKKDLHWAIGHKDSDLIYVVPAGFHFDVSIPAVLTWIFSPHDKRFLKAAALHDHMLKAGWSRVESGAIFHEALKADGVGKIKRLAMFLAVALYKYS